jgi:hypothetical protein
MFPAPFAQTSAVVVLIIGLIALFSGYRAFKALLAIAGFVTGAILTWAIARPMLEETGFLLYLLTLVGGLVCAIALVAFYFIGVFVAGAALGSLLGGMLAPNLNLEPALPVIIGAIVLGVVALLLQRFLIILSTAFGGAWLALSAGFFLLGLGGYHFLIRSPAELAHGRWSDAFMIGWVLLGLVGLAAQFRGKPANERRQASEG